jgi:hypothetical protein
MRLKPLLAILLLTSTYCRAEEQVRSVQEELRRRNIYFGDVDGRRTPELDAALKRYQKKKGFPEKGTEERETLRSLGLVPREPGEPPPKELAWPSEPVLKSDAAINVNQVAERIADETGVAPEAVGAAPEDAVPAGHQPARLARQTKAAAARTKARTAAKSRHRTPPTASAEPTGTASRRLSSLRAARKTQVVEPAEIRLFVKEYLRALGGSDVQEELQFYADQVSYYQNGEIDRRIIERTLRDYYKRWPKRKYRLGRTVDYSRRAETGEIVIVFRVSFELRKGRTRITGETDNRFIINAGTADPRIVSIQETRVRS